MTTLQIVGIVVSVIISSISLLTIGIGIGHIRAKYVTKVEFEQHQAKCASDNLEHRKAVWAKIDQMYDWMVTGVIQINRSK